MTAAKGAAVHKATRSCALCQRMLLATAGDFRSGRSHRPGAADAAVTAQRATAFAATELQREEGRLSVSLASFAPVREG